MGSQWEGIVTGVDTGNVVSSKLTSAFTNIDTILDDSSLGNSGLRTDIDTNTSAIAINTPAIALNTAKQTNTITNSY